MNEQPDIYPMPSFPILAVADVAASSRWYQEVLGFAHIFTMPGPGGVAGLAHLRWTKMPTSCSAAARRRAAQKASALRSIIRWSRATG